MMFLSTPHGHVRNLLSSDLEEAGWIKSEESAWSEYPFEYRKGKQQLIGKIVWAYVSDDDNPDLPYQMVLGKLKEDPARIYIQKYQLPVITEAEAIAEL